MASWLLSIGTAQLAGPADELPRRFPRCFTGASFNTICAALTVSRSSGLCSVVSAPFSQVLVGLSAGAHRVPQQFKPPGATQKFPTPSSFKWVSQGLPSGFPGASHGASLGPRPGEVR